MNPNDPNNSNDPASIPGVAPIGDQPVPPIPALQQDSPIAQPVNTPPALDNTSALPSFGDTNFTTVQANPSEPSALPPISSTGADLPSSGADQPLQPTSGLSGIWSATPTTSADQPNLSTNNTVPNTNPIAPLPQENTPPFGADMPGLSQPNWNASTLPEVAQQPAAPGPNISAPEPNIGISAPAMGADASAGLGNVLDQNPLGSPFGNNPPGENPANSAPHSGLDQMVSPFTLPTETVSQTPGSQEITAQAPSWLPPVSAATETVNSTSVSSPTATTDFNSEISSETTGVSEAVPTDLSHLIDSSMGMDNNTGGNSAAAQPETMIVPSDANQVVTTKQSGGFPKWIFAVAGVVLIAVITGSAYLILGVGKSEGPQPQVPEPPFAPTIIPQIIVPTIPPLNDATPSGEANFSNLQGAVPDGVIVSPSPVGSSAMDRIKSRLSPTPVLGQ